MVVGREGLLFMNLRAMYINIDPEQAPSSLSLVDARRFWYLSILLIFCRPVSLHYFSVSSWVS